MTASDARILGPAGGGNTPFSPQERRMLMAAGVKGFMLPLIILLALMFFDTRIKCRKDIEDATDIPFLGEIPQDKSKKALNAKGKEGFAERTQGPEHVPAAFRIPWTHTDFRRVHATTSQSTT